MWLVVAIVLQFILRLRFPTDKSIAHVIKDRYGLPAVRLIRKFESNDFKVRKCELDIDFINNCISHDLVPKFVQFKVVNRGLRSSKVYKHCQQELLREELHTKHKQFRTLQNKQKLLTQLIHNTVKFIDFIHITGKFLVLNNRKVRRTQLLHEQKLINLGLKSSVETNDPDKVIFNFSSRTLTSNEKSLLARGLNLSIPPKKLNYADFLHPFEHLYYQLHKDNPDIKPEQSDPLGAALKASACDCINSYDAKLEQNLPPNEVEALKALLKDEDIVIQKSDKGNSVVILNKMDYTARMQELLSDTTKFRELRIAEGKDYNYIINQEKRIRKVINRLKKKGAMTSERYEELAPSGTQPSVLYGLGKIHKPTVNNIPKLRPILSAINTPTYKLSQYLNMLLKPHTTNEYTAKDTFAFTEDIRKQDASLAMASLDVDSLFTNIPLIETVDICCDLLFNNTELVDGLSRAEFKELLTIATTESLILFNGKYYQQTDGVAMGSPLGPTLANIFLGYNEPKWLSNCPIAFKPLFYQRYVDDIFLLFKNIDCLHQFQAYLNSQHPNMNFTSELESENSLAFLDVYVTRVVDKFVTSVYRKPTFSGVYTNYDSYIPQSYKSGLVYTLLHRSFSICSSWEQFHKEIVKIKTFMRKNGYPSTLIDKTVAFFLNKLFVKPTTAQLTDKPTKTHQIILPYLGVFTRRIEKKIKKALSEHLPNTKLNVIYRASTRLRTLFTFKDKIPTYIRSGLIYKYTCNSCNAVYIGETGRHQKTRFCEHMGISPLTGKESKHKKESAIRDHLEHCNGVISQDCFTIIGRESGLIARRVKESLFIHKDKPLLNIQGTSLPLKLFKN